MGENRSFPTLPFLLALAFFCYAFLHLYRVLIPFGLSFALAYVVNPLVDQFEARGLRRSIAVMVFYLVISVAVSLLANQAIQVVTRELILLKAQVPTYIQYAREAADGFKLRLARHLPIGSSIIANWDMRLYDPIISKAQDIPSYVLSLFPLLSFVFLIPFITFFLLIDATSGIDSLIQLCPSRYVEQALHLISEIDNSLGNYLRGIIIVAAAITAASFLGLAAMGVNQALAIAVLSGVSSFVPYLGAIIGAVVGGLVAFFQFGTADAGLKVVLLFLVIRLLDETLLQPVIARHSAHLHPLVFLLTLLIGGELFGFIGLVFAVPIACVIKDLVKVTWAWYSTEARLRVPEAPEGSTWPYT